MFPNKISGFMGLFLGFMRLLEFFVLRLIMSGLAGWVCLDLGKNMKHEVHILGKKKNNVLSKK